MWNDSTCPAAVCTALPLLARLVTVAQEGAIGAGGGGGSGGGGGADAAAGAFGWAAGAGTKAGGAGVTVSTTLSSAATCDQRVVTSPNRNLMESVKATMVSACCDLNLDITVFS